MPLLLGGRLSGALPAGTAEMKKKEIAVLLATLQVFAANEPAGAAAELRQHETPQGRLVRSRASRRNAITS